MSESSAATERHPQGVHRYRSVVEGMELANAHARSQLSMAEFARQQGVSFRMVKYWTGRSRQLAVASSPDLVQVAEVSPSGRIEPMAQRPTPALPAPVTAAPAVAGAPPTIEVRLPNGVRIAIGAGFSPEALTQVIACVGRGSAC